MAMRPSNTVRLENFQGYITAIDPNDIPPGAAQEQVNLQCGRRGQLDVRQGLEEVAFETSTKESV